MTLLFTPPSLTLICQRFLLKYLRQNLRFSMGNATVETWQRHFALLPWLLREELLAMAMHVPGGDDLRTRDQLTNNALLLLDRHVTVTSTVSLSLSESDSETSVDLQLVLRHGHGVRRLVIYIRNSGTSVRLLRNLFRTCRSLQQLQLIGAGDSELKLVATQCQHLEELEVTASAQKAISDRGVIAMAYMMAAECTPIRSICFQQASLTSDSVMMVLEKLPQLEHLGCPNVIDYLRECDPDDGTLNLRELPEFTASGNLVLHLAKLCPFVDSLTLVLQQPDFRLQQLECFTNLQHLTFRCKDPYIFSYNDFEASLWRFGAQLKTLAISGDIYDHLDIAPIVSNCNTLHLLKVPSINCRINTIHHAITSQTCSLTNLTTFQCDCMTGVTVAVGRDLRAEVEALRTVLRFGVSLRVVRVRPFPLVDHEVESLIEENSLRNLEVFEVGPTQLGLPAARALIAGCPRLGSLGILKQWRGLQLLQIVAIRSLARAQCHPLHVRVT